MTKELLYLGNNSNAPNTLGTLQLYMSLKILQRQYIDTLCYQSMTFDLEVQTSNKPTCKEVTSQAILANFFKD